MDGRKKFGLPSGLLTTVGSASSWEKFAIKVPSSKEEEEAVDDFQDEPPPSKITKKEFKFTACTKKSDGNDFLKNETSTAPKRFGKPKFGLPGLRPAPVTCAVVSPQIAQPSTAAAVPETNFVSTTHQQNCWNGFKREPSRQHNQSEKPSWTGVKRQPSRQNHFAAAQTLSSNDASNVEPKVQPFRTAHEQLVIDSQKKTGQSYGSLRRPNSTSVGGSFRPPIAAAKEEAASEAPVDDRLKGIDPKLIELVENEIMDTGAPIGWSDIAGLTFVKTTVKEIVVFPLLRPDIFTGLRGPPKGLLLFGPPGTGKTLIGKCIASQSKSTFFSISASSLTSKWVGEGEKMVRALFAVARVKQPSVVFIDEIDSVLSARSDTEHESSRRIKTEFLVQLDGATTVGDERILVVGATNRPQDLDDAARRRLVKRLYVPLPDLEARKQIVSHLLATEVKDLQSDDYENVAKMTDGYSGADMANLCKEAAMGPIRCLDYSKMEEFTAADVRPINYGDFETALRQVRASVSDKDLQQYKEWDQQYGSGK